MILEYRFQKHSIKVYFCDAFTLFVFIGLGLRVFFVSLFLWHI